jgi:hypothetical protein
MALLMTAANSGSTMTAFASPWSSMKAMVAASRRVFKVLSTAPAMGTKKCASTMAGVGKNLSTALAETNAGRPGPFAV